MDLGRLMIGVFGYKGSGKTRILEWLIKELSDRGIRVAAVKHIHHSTFDVDVRGKDTWRFWRAGARIVLAASNKQIFINMRAEEGAGPLELVEKFVGDVDVVFFEGFSEALGRDPDVWKLVAVRSEEEMKRWASKITPPTIGFVGGCGLPGVYRLGDSRLIDFVVNLVSKDLGVGGPAR